MNIETDQKTLGELTGAFRFSDAVLRHLVVKMDGPVTEASPMARAAEEEGDGERGDRAEDGEATASAFAAVAAATTATVRRLAGLRRAERRRLRSDCTSNLH